MTLKAYKRSQPIILLSLATMSLRPEHSAPPEIFYNDCEARKYTQNSRIATIQAELSERALELLALPNDGASRLILDVGCGSCLSGDAITEAGHTWVGMDISQSMLDVAVDREVDGDVCLADMGQGLPIRGGAFDGVISISAVQWLCNADTSTADPRKRLRVFFTSLYACLTRGGRAVLQMYPENSIQAQMITTAAMRAGFSGGLVVDFPNSAKAKKYYLVLMVGQSAENVETRALTGEETRPATSHSVSMVSSQYGRKGSKGRKHKVTGPTNLSARHPESKGKAWVHKKKASMRKKGVLNVPNDSRYTGRKRKAHF